jgi:hypothetical protein
MELLHSKQDQVLAVDSNVFIGVPAALETFLLVTTATHIQNWIYVWKPIILSSVQRAKDWSIHGVRTLTEYLYQIQPLTRNPAIPTPKLTAQHGPVTKHNSSGYHNHPSSFNL